MRFIFSLSVKITVAFLIFIIIIIHCDYCLYLTEKGEKKFQYFIKNPPVHRTDCSPEFFSDKNILGWYGRKPDGEKYNNKKSILIFGCSYAYGQMLKYNQTLSYKLSETLQCPVYNNGIAGGGFQHMYYQTLTEDFYKRVKNPDTVIYILLNDHFRRMLGESFKFNDNYLYLHFKNKNGNLVIDNYSNYLLNFFLSSYSFRVIRQYLKKKYVENIKNTDKITDEALLYFIKTRENIEKQYNRKVKFCIFFYEPLNFNSMSLKKKLEENNFIVKTMEETADVSSENPKYRISDTDIHPSEKAWDVLTPLLIEKFDLQR